MTTFFVFFSTESKAQVKSVSSNVAELTTKNSSTAAAYYALLGDSTLGTTDIETALDAESAVINYSITARDAIGRRHFVIINTDNTTSVAALENIFRILGFDGVNVRQEK